MRKLLFIVLVLALAGVAGCGGSGDDSDSPLGNALGYLPADAPFAVVVETDLEGGQLDQAQERLGDLSFGADLGQLAQGLLESRAGDIEDIEKLLGNPVVVGTGDAAAFLDSGGEETPFVGAIEVADESALTDLIEKQGADEDGELDGATLYTDDSGDSFAVEDGVLVIAGSKPQLEQALATKDGDGHLTEDDFDEATSSIPDDALVRVYLDVGGLLAASPDAQEALRSKWVAALRTAGIGLSLSDDRVAVDFDVNTDPDGLTDEDLPIAAGADSPEVLDRARGIAIALRDPAQIAAFAQATARSIDPSGYDMFEIGLTQIEQRLGIDLERDLLGQLEQGIAVTIGLDGSFGARGEVSDPAALEQVLDKLAGVLPQFAEGATGEKVGFAEPGPGEDLYALATASGDRVVFGLVDGVLVVSDDPGLAAQLARAGTRPVAGAEGALVLNSDAEQLAQTLLSQIPFDTGIDLSVLRRGLADGPLDELNGSVEASTSGLSGGFELTLDRGSGSDAGDGGS